MGATDISGPSAGPPFPLPPALAAGPGWWWPWVRWATLGEFLGFAVPALTAAVVSSWPAWAAAPLLVLAGAAEGAALGLAQAHVLHRALPALVTGRWVLATAAGAVLAWSIGLLPMLADGALFALPVPILVVGGLLLGAALLGSIGTAQWLVLRWLVPGSARWIGATAGAWAVGLLVFTAITTPLWAPGQPAALIAAIGVLGGLAMAGTVAALTGWALVRLLRPPAR